MRRAIICAALALCAAASAQAQRPSPNDTAYDPMRDPDAVRREERAVNNSSREMSRMAREADAARRREALTFKARLVVTNSGAKAIRSVSWTASLTDRATGDVFRTYTVTTNKRIKPGKSATLEKRLPAPRAGTVDADTGRTSPKAADLKTSVVLITYEDGSTSEKP